MVKKPENVLKEYVAKLSDADLDFLESRLTYRHSGDLPEVLDFVAAIPEADRIFSVAKTANELYDLTDLLQDYVTKQADKRYADAQRK